MEIESDQSKRPYHRRPLQCRLCLREYEKPQLTDIFTKGSKYKAAIFAAVSVKTHRHDPLARICTICQDIVQLINDFRAACQKSEALLTRGYYVLKTDTLSCPENTSIFRRAMKLVRKHLHEIEAISNCDDQDGYTNNIKPDLEAQSEPQSHQSSEHGIFVSVVDEISGFTTDVTREQQRVEEALELQLETKHSTESVCSYATIEEHLELNCEEATNLNDSCQKDKFDDRPDRAKRSPRKSATKSDSLDKVICSTCGEFVSQQGLEGHLNRHLGVQPYSCDIEGCRAKLYSKFALQQHRSRHKSMNRYYDCEVCGKRIKGTAYWLIHRKIHTDEPRFQCDICGKKFRRRCKLKLHSTVHSGIAEFPCEICGKYFTVKHNLSAHYKLHMKNGTYPKGATFIAKSQVVQP